MVAVSLIFPAPVDPSTGMAGDDSLALLIAGVIMAVYVALLESSAKQATVGKMALGLKVMDDAGERLSLGRALYRAWPYYASVAGVIDNLVGTGVVFWSLAGILTTISCIVVAFTAKKQGIHDMMAGTLMVKK